MIKYSNKKYLYLIDFDGTITKNDSFLMFTSFSVSALRFFKYWISVILFFPFFTKSDLKEMFFASFKGKSINDFNSLCYSFYEKKLKKIIRLSFLKFLEKINEDFKIVVVSASINNYLKPFCEEMGFDLVSTELEVIDGFLTGKFSTPNCNGDEKIKRIEELYNFKEYAEIHVIGNSKADLPMLGLGTHKYYKFFK